MYFQLIMEPEELEKKPLAVPSYGVKSTISTFKYESLTEIHVFFNADAGTMIIHGEYGQRVFGRQLATHVRACYSWDWLY